MKALSLQSAQQIIDAARSKARALNLKPMTIAVVDPTGTIIALTREDGPCATLRPDIAIGKARAAIMMGPSGSRFWQEDFKARPNFVQGLMHMSAGSFLPGAGGVAILDDAGAPLGGVGCTGDISDKDEEIAIHGVISAGLTPCPDTPVTGEK